MAELLADFAKQMVMNVVKGKGPRTMGELECVIREETQAMMQAWLEMWLAELGEKRRGPEVPCPCGEQARYVRMRDGVILSIFGRVSIRRAYYVCPHCHKGQYPLDSELGFEAGQMSPQLMSLAGLVGAELPFQRATKLMQSLCGITLSENSVREATERMGREVAGQEAEWEAESQDVAALRRHDRHPEDDKPDRLYGSIDGVLVPVGKDWRELKIGSWYREGPRTEEETPPARDISYYCDITTADEFGPLFWATGYQRLADQARELIFVADGAVWIWHLVSTYYPQAVQIVDWYHAVEYIAPIGNAAYGENSTQSKEWQEQVTDDLWEGRFDRVLEAFKEWVDHPQAGQATCRAITYYTNNRHRMRYPEFRAKGYRIGSGTAESACKQIGAQRLKVAGARWSEQGARDTAKARAALLSGHWNSISSRLGAYPLAA
jgi:hypothetical protein